MWILAGPREPCEWSAWVTCAIRRRVELPSTSQLFLGAHGGPRRSAELVGVAVVDAADELNRGRQSYARRAWMDAYKSLSHADQVAPLGAEDLELLATSAYMLGRND